MRKEPEPHFTPLPYYAFINHFIPHPPHPLPDPVIAFRNATLAPSFKLSSSSSETSESEGICADFMDKKKISDFDDEYWTNGISSRFPDVQNLDHSVDFRDYVLQERRAFSVPRSSPSTSMIASMSASRISRIPVSIRPMSQSFCASNSPFSTPRRPDRVTKSLTETVNGSREQLCDSFTDVRHEAKLLLARSRARNFKKTRLDDRWLMQSSDLTRSLSCSFRASSPAKRLLARPRISRTADEIHADRTSMWLSKLRSDIESFVDDKNRSFESDDEDFTVTLPAPKGKRQAGKKNEFGGNRPLPMERLIRWYRNTRSFCSICRAQNRHHRLAKRSLLKGTSQPGIGKRGVSRRNQCTCSDDVQSISIPFNPNLISSSKDPIPCYLTDLAALFAAVAFVIRMILILFFH